MFTKIFDSITELFTKNLFFLTNAMAFSEFGNVIYATALSFWVLDITKSTLIMGWISFIAIIPQLVLSPLIGMFVDKHNTKKIMIAMDIIRGMSMCLFGFITLFGVHNIALIIGNSIFIAVSNCFYQTSVNASIKHIFKEGKFIECNSMANSVINFVEICAASVAGLLLSILAAPVLFIINGVTFFVSAFSSLFLIIPYKSKEKMNISFNSLRESIMLCKDNAPLMNFVAIRCILGLLLQINLILIIPLFKLKYNVLLYGFSNSFRIAGTLIGGISLIYLKKYFLESKVLIFSLVMLALPLLLISHTNIWVLLPTFMFLIGFAFNIYNILTESNIILLVPDEHRAKSLSIIFQIIFFFTGIGSLIGGFLGKYIDIPLVLTVNSIIILIVSIIFYKYKIKNMPQGKDNG